MLRLAEIILPCVDPDRTAEFYAGLSGAERDGRRVNLGGVTLVCEQSHRLSLTFEGAGAGPERTDPDGRIIQFDGNQRNHGVAFNPEDRPEDAGIG
jgi:hypothetical protein